MVGKSLVQPSSSHTALIHITKQLFKVEKNGGQIRGSGPINSNRQTTNICSLGKEEDSRAEDRIEEGQPTGWTGMKLWKKKISKPKIEEKNQKKN